MLETVMLEIARERDIEATREKGEFGDGALTPKALRHRS